MADLTLGEAAKAIGVSADTLRRWDRSGKLRTTRDERNRRLVPPEEVERLSGTPRRHQTGNALSARNRFAGVVKSVDTFDMADGRVIAYNGRETPTVGRELSVIEQLLGTVGTPLSQLPDDDPGRRPGQ